MSRRPDDGRRPGDWPQRLRALARGELSETEAAALREELADDPVLAEQYLDLLDELADPAEGDDMIAVSSAAPRLDAVLERARTEARDELVDAIVDRLALAAGRPALAIVGGSAADRAALLARVDRRLIGLGIADARADAARDPFLVPGAGERRALLLDDALAAPLLSDLLLLATRPILLAVDEASWTAARGDVVVARTFHLGSATGHAREPRARTEDAAAALAAGDARRLVAGLQTLARRGRPGPARALVRAAQSRIGSLIGTDPASALAWARLLRGIGEPGLAALALERATPAGDVLLGRERALLLADRGDVAGACRELEALDRGAPGHVLVLESLATLESRRGATDRAEAALVRALAIDPANPGLLLTLARVLAAAREWDWAERAFGRALELAPSVAGVLTAWARALADDGRLVDAAATVARAVGVEPWNVAHRVALAEIQVQRGDLAAAEAAARAALAVAPDDADAVNALALVHAAGQRWEPAADRARAALGREPSAEGHRVLARVADGRGQLRAALRHLRDALALDPLREDLWRAWRDVLSRVGSSFAFTPAWPPHAVAAAYLTAMPSAARGRRWIMHEEGDTRVLVSESLGGELVASIETRGQPVAGAAVTLLEETSPGREEERASGATDENGEAILGLAAGFAELLEPGPSTRWRFRVTLPPASADDD